MIIIKNGSEVVVNKQKLKRAADKQFYQTRNEAKRVKDGPGYMVRFEDKLFASAVNITPEREQYLRDLKECTKLKRHEKKQAKIDIKFEWKNRQRFQTKYSKTA